MEQYSTVNKENFLLDFEEGSAAVMAVTTAQLGQALAMRGFQAGKLAGNRQEKQIRCRPL